MGAMHPAHSAPPGAVPILVYCEGELDLLPDMPATQKRRRQATAHSEIAQAVATARAICNPHRAADARRQPVKRRRASRTVSMR